MLSSLSESCLFVNVLFLHLKYLAMENFAVSNGQLRTNY